MKRIKLIARQRHIEPKTGKRYSDAKLMTVNAYYEDVFEVPDDFNKTMFSLQFEVDHPEMKGWLLKLLKKQILRGQENAKNNGDYRKGNQR